MPTDTEVNRKGQENAATTTVAVLAVHSCVDLQRGFVCILCQSPRCRVVLENVYDCKAASYDGVHVPHYCHAPQPRSRFPRTKHLNSNLHSVFIVSALHLRFSNPMARHIQIHTKFSTFSTSGRPRSLATSVKDLGCRVSFIDK